MSREDKICGRGRFPEPEKISVFLFGLRRLISNLNLIRKPMD